ncbi:MAG: GNAT family N-acetyltransferase [Deltaproteobacteria bacterium]|nr:GNAT family N-acetyltransferase [Deltaproteobacteria bacterium]
MAELIYKTIFNPPPEGLGPIKQGFQEFIAARTGGHKPYEQKLAIMVEDEETRVIGGVCGDLSFGWLNIHLLWVHEDHRGKDIGTKLLSLIEEAALSKQIHQSQLETSDFMALDFYLKHGYEIFAELEGKPAGGKWYYMKKNLFSINTPIGT